MGQKTFRSALVFWMATTAVGMAAERRFPFTIPSNGERYMAMVIPAGKDARRASVPEIQETEKVAEYDFRLEIYEWPKRQLIWSKTFTARDNAHDQSLTWGLWTNDSAYFVFLTVNPDQRRPAEYHCYAFDLRKQSLHLLDPYIGHAASPIFGVTAPHTADVSVRDPRAGSLNATPRKLIRADLERLLADKPPL